MIKSTLLLNALQRHQAGDLQQAELLYRRVLQNDPECTEAWHLLGLLAHQAGRNNVAIEHLHRAVALEPLNAMYGRSLADVHRYLGLALKKQGKLVEAEASFRQAVAAQPDFVEAYNNLGTTQAELGKVSEAESCFRQAIALNPGYVRAYRNLGLLLQGQARFRDMETVLRAGLAFDAENAETHFNLGLACQQQGKLAGAEAGYRQAVTLRPDYVAAYQELGRAQYGQRKFKEALQTMQRAAELKPEDGLIQYQIGSILEAQHRVKEAVAAYDAALKLEPGREMWRFEKEMLSPLVMESAAEIEEWRAQIEGALEKYPAGMIDLGKMELVGSGEQIVPPYPPFEMVYHGRDERPFRERFGRLFKVSGEWGEAQSKGHTVNERYRIGFLVTRGHEGMLVKLMGGMVETFDSAEFEVVVIGPAVSVAQIKPALNRDDVEFLAIPEDARSAARQIKREAFDLVYYLEIGTDTLNYALPFFRLAPVQCTSWGTPTTSGVPQVDYYISSELFEPEQADNHYTEQLVRLRNLPIYYHRPPVPFPLQPRAYFGLPEYEHIYLCCQNLMKFQPEFDWILGEILRRDPRGRLVLVENTEVHLSAALARRFRKTMPAVARRIQLFPRQNYGDYLNLIALADVALDTIHFGGGNTALETLTAGTPLVTLPGQFMRGRMALGCYKQMGVPNCVAATPEAYVEIAVRLGADRRYRELVKGKIKAANGALIDNQEAVREMEQFFRAAIKAARSGQELPPDFLAAGQAQATGGPKFYFGRGIELWKAGEVAGAADCFRQAARLEPGRADAQRYLGLALKKQGRLAEAEASFRQAVAAQPDFAEAYNNLGTTLAEQEKPAEAIASFQQAVRLRPDYFRAHYNLGVVQLSCGHTQQAIRHFEMAIAGEPDNILWRLEKDLVCPQMMPDRESIEQWRAKIEAALDTYPAGSVDLARWQSRISGSSNVYPPFHLAYHNKSERALREKLARLFAAPEIETAPVVAPAFPPGAPYRIGFLVTGNHEQGVLYFVAGIINHLNNTLFNVSVICPAPGVGRIQPSIANENVNFVTIPQNLAGAAQKIKAEKFNLIYFWEVGTDTLNYLLPFYRLAPVQCVSWGMPTTTGAPAVDYYISSRLFETEESRQHYSEQLVQLSGIPAWYHRPPLPPTLHPLSHFGLSEGDHHYLCCQNLMKLHPDFDRLLGSILRRDPLGKIVLVKSGKSWINEALQHRLRRSRPVGFDRIQFIDGLDYGEYLSLLQVADVVLDTLYFNGGATTLEALAVGTPVVTLPGKFMRGRMTRGCYRLLGVMDCVAHSADEYVEIAVRLGTNRPAREALRAKILAANNILFEDANVVQELELFFVHAIKQAGGEPAGDRQAEMEPQPAPEAEALRQQGLMLKNEGRLEDALAAFWQALAIAPDYAPAHNNLGTSLAELGNPEAAALSLQRAIQLKPDFARAHYNLGLLLQQQGKLDAAAHCYRQALQLQPDYPAGHRNLAAVLVARQQYAAAEIHLKKVVAAQPEDAESRYHLAVALARQNKFEAATAGYENALKLMPENPFWRLEKEMLCPSIVANSAAIDRWRTRAEKFLASCEPGTIDLPAWLPEILKYQAQPPFHIQYQGKDNRGLKAAYARLFSAGDVQFAENTPPNAKLRLGFFVDAQNEAVFLRLMGGVINHLRLPACEITVIGSAAGIDFLGSRITNRAVGFLQIPADFGGVIETIKAARFDLLYFLEVGSSTLNYFLPFFRPAPVQCASWGVTETSGIPQVDYYFSSEFFETAEAPAHYTERLVLLKTLLSRFPRPARPAQPKTRLEFGLPEQAHLYLCPQSRLKFHPDFDALVASVLRRDPAGQFVAVSKKIVGWQDGQWLARMGRAFPDVTGRIQILPEQSYGDYLALFSVVDVVLDTVHVSGGMTSYDALAFGTPIVTLPTQLMRGRITQGYYQKMGVLDCVARDAGDYVDIAVRLGADPVYRRQIKAKIMAANNALFDDDAVVREYERVFRQILAAPENHQPERITPHASRAQVSQPLDSTAVDSILQRGLALWRTGQFNEATPCFERAVRLFPQNVAAHRYYGLALKKQGKLGEAERCFRRALEIQPEYVEAQNNLATTLAEQGKLNEAAACFRQTLQLKPDYARAHNNLGLISGMQNQAEAAIEHYRRALQIDPAYVMAHYNLATALAAQNKIPAAQSSFRQALALTPQNTLWRLEMDMLCPAIMASTGEIATWRNRLENALNAYPEKSIKLSDGLSAASGAIYNICPPYNLAYHGQDERPFREKFAALIDAPPAIVRPRAEGRYRIAFLVTKEHEAIFVKLMGGMLDQFRAGDWQVSIICPQISVERIRPNLKNEQIDFITIPENVMQAVNVIRQKQLDLIYYWEVGSDALNYTLPFFRPAPVQCTSWGLSLTSGIPQMDYFISSELLEADNAERHYTEQLVKFKTLPAYYYRPQLPVPLKSRQEFGLPDRANLYLCPQTLMKFHPEFDWILGQILRGDPDGRLVLLTGTKEAWVQAVSHRLGQTLNDVLGRVQFLPPLARPDYINLMAIADVMLDTLHYSGGNTSHEALGSGTPIVTLPGKFLRGRLTLGRYQKMGVADCVVWSREAYVEKALQLGQDQAYRAAVRAKILAAAGALYQDAGAVREMEQFFRWAIERARMGE